MTFLFDPERQPCCSNMEDYGKCQHDIWHDLPLIFDDAQNMSELMDLFLQGYEDIPFTPAEEEMLPVDG